MKQGAVKEGSFAFKLASGKSGSELFVGGTNSALYTGDIEFHPVVSDAGYWVIGNGAATVDGKAASNQLVTIIDSGTTLVATGFPRSYISRSPSFVKMGRIASGVMSGNHVYELSGA